MGLYICSLTDSLCYCLQLVFTTILLSDKTTNEFLLINFWLIKDWVTPLLRTVQLQACFCPFLYLCEIGIV